MSALAIGVLVAVAAGAATWLGLRPRIAWRRQAGAGREHAGRILLPFCGEAISRRALDAALRIAAAEHATLMPAYLVAVPRTLPLDAPLPRRADAALPLLEAIEQRAARSHVLVDARISRGRTSRDALRRLLAGEHVDRVVVPASADGRGGPGGFSADDLVWLLERAPAEVLILRPDAEHAEVVTGERVRGLF